jgi:hypothetical protein
MSTGSGSEVQARVRRSAAGHPGPPAAHHDTRRAGSVVDVDRSTITRAINEIRPLLADRGCRVEHGIRLRTVADVIAHLDSVRHTALMDATEIRVRRPTVKRAGRHQFVSGKTRQNAMKGLVVTDARGRILFGGATCRAAPPTSLKPARSASPAGFSTPRQSRSSLTPAAKDWARRVSPSPKGRRRFLLPLSLSLSLSPSSAARSGPRLRSNSHGGQPGGLRKARGEIHALHRAARRALG